MYIISEISPQFHGEVKVAEQMILQSKMAGADAIKVQLYDGVQFGTERAYLSMPYDQLERLKNFLKFGLGASWVITINPSVCLTPRAITIPCLVF